MLRILYLWLSLWFLPKLKGAQVVSKIKEQTEVQVGCKLGKNMFYQEKKNSASKICYCVCVFLFSFCRSKVQKREPQDHTKQWSIFCVTKGIQIAGLKLGQPVQLFLKSIWNRPPYVHNSCFKSRCKTLRAGHCHDNVLNGHH